MVLHPIEAGNFKLDGGAMFGVVPKSLVAKNKHASDSNNMIDMSARCLLVENGNKLILDRYWNGRPNNLKEFFSYYYQLGK